jgi:hypothetical protein
MEPDLFPFVHGIPDSAVGKPNWTFSLLMTTVPDVFVSVVFTCGLPLDYGLRSSIVPGSQERTTCNNN